MRLISVFAATLSALAAILIYGNGWSVLAKKTTANKTPLGQVRVNNIQKAKFKKLAGPPIQSDKIELQIKAIEDMKKKLERKERLAGEREKRKEEKIISQVALRQKIRSSSLLFRALAATRRVYEVEGPVTFSDEYEEEEELEEDIVPAPAKSSSKGSKRR